MKEITVTIIGVVTIGLLVWFGYDALLDWRESDFEDYNCDQLLAEIQTEQAVKNDFPVRKWIGDECWK